MPNTILQNAAASSDNWGDTAARPLEQWLDTPSGFRVASEHRSRSIVLPLADTWQLFRCLSMERQLLP